MRNRYEILTMLLLGVLPFTANAANWYVRPNGSTYGSANGTSWTNAWSGFSGMSWGSVACGDTIWVAGGNYTQALVPTKSCTSGSPLSIRRARSDATESTGAAGWSANFDSNVHQIGTTGGSSIACRGNYDYITISGRTTAGGGSNGWHLDYTATTGGTAIQFDGSSAGCNGWLLEYIDNQGPGAINYSAGGGNGIDNTAYQGTVGRNTFSHIKIWNWESGIYHCYSTGDVFEYIEMYNIMAANWQTLHPNGIYICGGTTNGTVRYSKFYGSTNQVGEGIFFSDANSGWKIYGNVFYNLSDSTKKAIQTQGGTQTNLKIFNNVFDNVANPVYGGSSYCGSGSEFRNNILLNSNSASCGTSSNNLTSNNASIFVNRTARDYHIVDTVGPSYPRHAGTDLSAYFTTDMDGVTFGSDGVWDIGAYQYSANPGTQVVAPPENLRIQ